MTVATVTDESLANGYVRVQWADGAKPGDWRSWRVYTRPGGTAEWKVLHETFVDVANYDYQLYQFIDGMAADYSVVYTEQAGPTGVVTVEAFTDVYPVTPTGDGKWHLIDPLDSSKNVKIERVTAYPESHEVESQSYHLIGRGRKIDRGDYLGVSGSMSGDIQSTPTRTARSQMDELERIFLVASSLFLRSPFGRTYQVQIQGLSFTPTSGTGLNEVVSWSFDVTETGGVPIGFG